MIPEETLQSLTTQRFEDYILEPRGDGVSAIASYEDVKGVFVIFPNNRVIFIADDEDDTDDEDRVICNTTEIAYKYVAYGVQCAIEELISER